MIFTLLFTTSLIANFNFATLSSEKKVAVDPLRSGKVHYVLVQRWSEKDATGATVEKEQKVCDGDIESPVFYLGDNDGIPADQWKTVECLADAKPTAVLELKPIQKTRVTMNFFVIFMNLNIFGAKEVTKNFVSFVHPTVIRGSETGFVSSSDLKTPSISYPTHSVATVSDYYQIDGSEYIASAKFTDEGPAPLE